jgi:O-antigen/teichoic acid export membrane protein
MTEARGLGRDALLYALATFISSAAGFVAMYLFSRLLPPSEYGYYYLVLSVVDITSGLSTTWINLSLVRLYAGTAENERPEFIGRLLAANLWSALLLCALALLASPITAWTGQGYWLPLVVLMVVLPQSWMGFAQNLFRTQRRPKEWALTMIGMGLGRLALGWWALSHISASGLMLVVVQSIAVLVSAVYAALRLRQRIALRWSSFGWQELGPVVRYGLPTSLVSSGGWLMSGAGRLILGALAGTTAVGIYASAYQIASNLMQIGMQPVALAAETITFRVYEREGPEAARQYMQKYVGLLLLMVTGIGTTLFLLRRPVVEALLDPQYAAAAGLLVFLAPAVCLMQIHPTLARSFEYTRKTASLAKYTFSAGIVNLVLNFSLAPWLRETGSSIATLGTYIFYVANTYIGGQKRFRWPLPWITMAVLPIPTLALTGFHLLLSRWMVPHGTLRTLGCALLYLLVYTSVVLVLLARRRGWLGLQRDFIIQAFLPRVERA